MPCLAIVLHLCDHGQHIPALTEQHSFATWYITKVQCMHLSLCFAGAVSHHPDCIQVLEAMCGCRWHDKSETPSGQQQSQPQGSPVSLREAQEPQPRKNPWYKGREQGTKLSQSRVLSEREMEQIELGGAA